MQVYPKVTREEGETIHYSRYFGNDEIGLRAEEPGLQRNNAMGSMLFVLLPFPLSWQDHSSIR